MPHLQTSAGRVSYTDTGTGPILVLPHATLHDHHDYDPVLPALAPNTASSPWTGPATASQTPTRAAGR